MSGGARASAIGRAPAAVVENFAARLRAWVLDAVAVRPFVVLFVAGAASILAMAPFFCWPVLFVTLPVLFWSLDAIGPRYSEVGHSEAGHSEAKHSEAGHSSNGGTFKCLRSAAFRGWAFGFGYQLAGLYWIGFSFLVQAERFAVLMPFAIGALTAALGLFFALAGVLFAGVKGRLPGGLARVVALAAAVMACEWLRGHILTGFPWNTLGYALTMPLPLMQWAGLFGIYVLTAIAVIVLTAPLVLLGHSGPARWRLVGLVTVVPLVFGGAYGSWQLATFPIEVDPSVRLRLVQPSFSQRDKFIAEKRGEIFRRHLEMSAAGFRPGQGRVEAGQPTHIVWPEAAMPFFVRREPAALAEMDAALPDGVKLIAGSYRTNVSPDVPASRISNFRTFNTAFVIGGDGRVLDTYDKIHLVPFGEYLPMQGVLGALGFENLTRTHGGLALGEGPRRLMQIEGLPPASMLICYEASFPGEVVQGSATGDEARPGVLINLTNDAWFGTTTGPYQHLHQTRLRAVEQGAPVIRSANNGISAVIGPKGRIVARLGLNDVGVVDAALPRATGASVYALWGAWIELAAGLVMLGYMCFAAVYSRRMSRAVY